MDLNVEISEQNEQKSEEFLNALIRRQFINDLFHCNGALQLKFIKTRAAVLVRCWWGAAPKNFSAGVAPFLKCP